MDSNSYSGVYKFVGIAAIIILTLLGIAGISYDGKSDNGETSSFFSVGVTVDDIKTIKTIDKMQGAIKIPHGRTRTKAIHGISSFLRMDIGGCQFGDYEWD